MFEQSLPLEETIKKNEIQFQRNILDCFQQDQKVPDKDDQTVVYHTVRTLRRNPQYSWQDLSEICKTVH